MIQGIQFHEASNGKETFDILSKVNNIELILIDIMMPIMDGFELAEKLLKKPNLATIPILFLSAKTDELTKSLALMKARYFIEKPFINEDLNENIKEC
jgi:CheY-like chemotaxis protein